MQSANPKKILFANDSDAVAAADQAKLIEFGSILSMTKHPKLKVRMVGRASTSGTEKHNQDLSQRRVNNAVNALRQGGTIHHDIVATAEGETGAGAGPEWRRVELDIDAIDAAWKNDYDIAGHETGHMFGFGEEYQGADKSPHYALVEEALGKKIADTFVSREARSASIMSSGLPAITELEDVVRRYP